MSRRLSKIVALSAGVALIQCGMAAADTGVIYSQNFNGLTPFTGAPNTSALGVDPIYYFSYSGNDAAANTAAGGFGGLVRTEGVEANGFGGTTGLFQAFDSSNVRVVGGGNTWWYSGLGAYRYVDPAVGIPAADPSKVTWTFDMRADGLTNTAAKSHRARIAFQNPTSNGNAYMTDLNVKLTDQWATYGGTLDTFVPQLVDDDFNGGTPPVEGNFLNANSINFQWDMDTGDWGNDAGNVLHVDNLNVTYVRPGWIGASGGSWTNGANWNDNGGNAPTSDMDFPIFSQPASNAPVAVALNEAVSTARVDFFGTQPYTIAGTGSLTIAGPRPAAIIADGGDTLHTINVPVVLNKNGLIRVNYGNGTVDLAGGITGTGILTKDRAGNLIAKHIRLPELRIQHGTVRIASGGGNDGTSVLTKLTFTGGTTETPVLDVTDARLIVNYDGASPLADLRAKITAASIKSSTGDPARGKVVAVEASAAGHTATFGGQPTDSTSVLILYTLSGDANVDKSVTFDDLLKLAQNYGPTTGRDWTDGDSTGDGIVNFDDLLALAQNYGSTVSLTQTQTLTEVGGASFAGEFALARSLVPEPTSLAAAGAAIGLLSRRRR